MKIPLLTGLYQKFIKPQAVTPMEKQIGTDIRFGRKGLSPGQEIGLGSDPLAIYRSGSTKMIPADRAMASYNGWVFAAVKAISDEIAAMQFRLFQITADGNHEEQFDHELLDLLDGVNEFQTGPEMKATIGAHLELTGNAYWYLAGVKNILDKPTSLFALNPGRMKLIFDKSVFPWKIIKYEYNDNGIKRYFKPYEILHFKYPDPSDPYSGIGTVQLIAPWIDNDNMAMEYNRQFFLKGANLDGYMQSESRTEAELNALKITFESNHAGVENSHKMAFLPNGVKFVPTQANAKDMDFKNMLDVMRDRILAGFRVSKTILGTAESDTNRSTAETADYVFSKRTIKPKMQLLCSFINEFLVPRYGENIYIGFLDPTPEDKNFRIQEMQAVSGNQPILSVNEVRENYLGRGPVDGGDTVKISNTFSDLGAPTEPKPGTTPPPQKTVPKKRTIKTRFARNAEVRKAITTSFTEKMISLLQAAKTDTAPEKLYQQMNHDEYEEVVKNVGIRVGEYEKEIDQAMQEINGEQEKEVIDNVTKLSKEKALSEAEIFDVTKWVGATTDILTPILQRLMGEEGKHAAAGIGKPGIDIMASKVHLQALDDAIALLSRRYQETTMSQLKDKLTEGFAGGEGLDKMTELVNSIYDFANTVRASMVAKTETFRVANYASKAAWKESGVVKTIKWHTAEDDRVEEYCRALDGKVIGIEDDFFKLGDKVKGADGGELELDYSDVGAPPLHTQCRCYTQPEDVSID